ncbi:hypothetical protein SAMN05216505_101735 [Streptomyces prasinopilosus]|uniref:Uncharacterized protein n=1 Tax=Streptomyces prasinopilosus TaxID=67344 RepID=A0A1G6JME9_9ACTN|nr:hypothetical protein SAMN05216505_101735 [Streptomyces prasinopilosus]
MAHAVAVAHAGVTARTTVLVHAAATVLVHAAAVRGCSAVRSAQPRSASQRSGPNTS